MKLRIKKIIDLQSLLMWVGLLCVVSFALLEHMSIPIPMFSAIKLPILYAGGVCVIPLLPALFGNIRKRRYFWIYLVLFALCAALFVSMKQNANTVIGYSPEQNTIRLVLYLLELFVLMLAFAERGMGGAAIKMVYSCVLFLVVLTDFFMFTGLLTFGTPDYPSYLVGTKFTVTYMHFNLLALWVMQQWSKDGMKSVKKWRVWTAAAVVALVAIYVDCMSGVLGSVLLAWLIVSRSGAPKITQLLTSPWFFLICVVAATWISFVIGFFLDLPFVTIFIEDVLGRNTTLTGRVAIYQGYGEMMQSHWLLGYGYGSGSQVSYQFFGCANAQNAVLQWVLQSGVVVTALLITLFALILRQLNIGRKEVKVAVELLVVLIYVYIVLGIVEITYSMSFILFMALIFMAVNDKNFRVSSDEEQAAK